ncbi:MAG: pantoate--beta-alanine ligase, partial [Pseudomonadota bacterium]
GAPIVREPDGLAMSSRNHYLTPDETNTAPRLYAALCAARDRMRHQKISPAEAEEGAARALKAAGFRLDYVSVRRCQDLALPQPDDRKFVILAAAWLGRTRLIDNLEFEWE